MPDETSQTDQGTDEVDWPTDTANFTQVLETAVAAKAAYDVELVHIDEWRRDEVKANNEDMARVNRRTLAIGEVAENLKTAARRRYHEAIGLDPDDDPSVLLYDVNGYRVDRYGRRI